MASYNYGPPPPAPPPAPPSSSNSAYPPYSQPYQRGGYSGRGRGGPAHLGDRGGYHGSAPPYGYSPQQPQYGQQPTGPYPPHHAHGGYASQQQWQPEHGHSHAHQPHPQPALPPQNYHPNYAPQLYQQQQQQQVPPQYGQQQPPYAPQSQPHYSQPYQNPPPQHGPPSQQWASHSPPPPSNQGHFGGGRGGRDGFNDRGGPKSQVMGPPIRMGFENGNPSGPAAPVSHGYPQQGYSGPHGPSAPFAPAAYQAYPPPAPYAGGPPHFDGQSGQHQNQRHGRGGFHNNNNFKNRHQFGGDKARSRNRGGPSHTPPAQHQKPDAASAGKKKKRKTNTLGLTPGDESDEDDENEEERLNEMIGDDAPNPTDIAAWIEERRRNFPTKARVEARKAAAKFASHVKTEPESRDSHLERQQQKAEKLRRQLEKVESSIKRKREQQDEGDEMRDVDAGSTTSEDSDSDDDKPETMSTHQEVLPQLPPPPRKADPTKHCKYYSTGGTCGKKGKCRFVHDSSVREAALREREMNGGRMTLQQRLTLNDKEQEDLTIVQTLKYLQDKGLLTPNESVDSTSPSVAAASTAQPGPKHRSLPPTPVKQERHSLPPIPPSSVVSPSVASHTSTEKYNGWNLSGFGNTGVKPGER